MPETSPNTLIPSATAPSQIPCTVLKGVGAKMSERLAKCDIHSVQDLLFHLPLRYQDRTRVVHIGSLRAGDHAVIEGVIEWAEVSQGRRRALLCRISDHTGMITLRFFHFNASQYAAMVKGKRLRCYGEVRGWNYHDLEIIHPEYHAVTDQEIGKVEEHLTPIYPTTEGLQQRSLLNLTDQALKWLETNPCLPDYLPVTLLQRLKLPGLSAALHYVHRPPPNAEVNLLEAGMHPAQQRLAFEELLAHHLSLQRMRASVQQNLAPAFTQNGELRQAFLAQLPFALTNAQLRVSQEISADLHTTSPMLRLVQGDVGSGKTVVAALAMLQAIENNYQAVLMAPTELLGEQHFQNFCQWLKPLGIEVAWLAGKLQGKTRQNVLSDIAEGAAKIIVGTHALFQKEVMYNRLGLIIVDEQHRFGVHQRLALREKGIQEGNIYPHQLIMTATPIPRTLAMTAYADLDHSIIDALPPGRTPVKTVAIPNERRQEVISRIKHVCEEGHQAYWVCTLIEESEVLQCQAAQVTATQLSEWLPEIRIGLVHGRMKSTEKEQVMADFKTKKLDLLVATTVIEVGVDVPNANLMIVENPERLGLAQLHQLRGRVGRGATVSYCVLLYQNPLSYLAKQRLAILRDSNDGFEIAQRDLELRGPGEVLGTKQTGLLRLRVADLLRDQKLLSQVKEVSEILLRDNPEHANLLIKRWLGSSEQYGSV